MASSPSGTTAGASGSRRSQGGAGALRLRLATIDRPRASACSSSSASWSATPERRVWTSEPPSSSGVTSSPVAAFTSGGPPRKIVPVPRTMTVSSLIAGTYAPPAVHEPITSATCGMPGGGHPGLVVEDPAEVVAIGEDLRLERQEGAARVDEVDARQPVLEGDLLGPEVLLDRHRVVGAALDRGVVGDDDAGRPLDPADPGDDPGAGRVVVVEAGGGQRAQLEEGGCPGRAGARCARGPAACRVPGGARWIARRHRRRARRRRPAEPAGRRRALPSRHDSRASRPTWGRAGCA